jgi:thiol:disulfide interchange protein DsbC
MFDIQMNIIRMIGAGALLALLMQASLAETMQEAAVRNLIQSRMGSQVKVDTVTGTPYSGLFEVKADGEIFYTDAAARFMFAGHIIDTATYRDYTAVRLEEISRISFSDLPLKSALKQVKGNGKRVIAVFEDPNCGYCKRFRQTLHDMDNVTVYIFMYNILAEDSAIKSRNIWCAKDATKAWDDWMLQDKTPPDAPAGCIAPNDQVLALGKKFRVTGTPTIIFKDGSRMQGALDKATLEKKLAAIQ